MSSRKGRRLAAVPALPPSATAGEVAGTAEVLRPQELDIRHRLDGILSGDHRTAAIGPGSERAGAREYQPGDDARRIDWSLTARSLEPHVRTTEADRELETWVVADRSASLDFGTADREKREVVLAVAAAFGVLTVRSANRFGVVVAGAGSLHPRPAKTGRAAMMATLAALQLTPRREPGGDGGDLADALLRLRRTQARRGQVVVASDFLDRGDWQSQLRVLALRHQVIAVHITDPRELDLPDVGMLTVVDPETGRELHVHTGSGGLRERYAAAARQRHTDIRGSLRAAGAEYLHLSTDRDWVLDVLQFATGRRARLRSGALAAAVPSSTGGA
jgi:uncharacterized protein (DUF58 family)